MYSTYNEGKSVVAERFIGKFNKRKVYSQFKDNIWGVDLADMQSLSRKNKGIKYVFYVL